MGQDNDRDGAQTEFLTGRIASSQLEIRQLRTDLAATDRELREGAKRLLDVQRHANTTSQRLEQEMLAHQGALAELMAAQGDLNAIRSSTVWRASAPLRALGRRAPGLARLAGRGAWLLWWIATLQVFQRLRQRREQRAAALPEPPPPPPRPPPLLDVSTPLGLDLTAEPVVSIVLCAEGRERMTLACLRSIAAAPPAHPIEIVMIDDAAPITPELTALAAFAVGSGVRVVRNETRLGACQSRHKGAALARGRYLHLLDGAAELRSGAVDALADLLETRPDAGMAGSKLLFADGTLQAAGGTVWRDGSASGNGRTQDPALPEFEYVHEADYCDLASAMIRRELWQTLAPDDRGDADLAFRVRAHGLKVLYEPRSVAVQNANDKAAQDPERMLERWRTVLENNHYEPGTHVMRARDRARSRTVALVIDHYALEPDRDGGSRALMAAIQGLLDADWVVKYWPYNQRFDPVYTRRLEALGVEVIDERRAEEFGAWLHREGTELDHVVVGRPEIAIEMIPHLLRHTRAALTLFGHDLHFMRMRRQAAVTGDAAILRQAAAMERLERGLWPMFDVSIYLSEEEATAVRALAPDVTVRTIVQFCFEVPPARPAPPPRSRPVLFVAGFAHPPNVDAAAFLVREVVPALEARVGPVQVVLAGSSPTDAVKALAGERVEVTGFLTELELEALYRSCRVAIVPLRFGAGVKGKVIEALSQGLPLATTPTGIEGLDEVARLVPVHDDPAGLAAALARLIEDDAAWLAQSHAQTALAAERFSRAAMSRSIVAALATARRGEAN